MNLILLMVIGFLIFIGTYMILSVNLIRIVIGISIYTHAGNLIIMSMGNYSKNKVEPLIGEGSQNYWFCYDGFPSCISLQNLSCDKRR